MKAVRLVQIGGPLALQEIDPDPVGPGDVLIRVRAAGICHSDAHYRGGVSPVRGLPLTLGHEVSGIVEEAGDQVTNIGLGDRVCVHYLATCGKCVYCAGGIEQFCVGGAMIGKHRNGGFAEFITVPARSVFKVPVHIGFEVAAVMMCSTATAFHALRRAALVAGESVAIFGTGGLGMSAIQLARAMGARAVYAVDIEPTKLGIAKRLGAEAINAAEVNPVERLKELTGGCGVDVALELIGLPLTIQQAIRCLAVQGRAAIAGIANKAVEISTYSDLLCKETTVIGVSDHLASEIPALMHYAEKGQLDFEAVITRVVPLEAEAINETLDRLERFGNEVRVVIRPSG